MSHRTPRSESERAAAWTRRAATTVSGTHNGLWIGENVSVALITGSGGLIGSEAAMFFGARGLDVVGIDNDMRRVFFGAEASTEWNRVRVQQELGTRYVHHDLDIRDRDAILALVRRYGS